MIIDYKFLYSNLWKEHLDKNISFYIIAITNKYSFINIGKDRIRNQGMIWYYL